MAAGEGHSRSRGLHLKCEPMLAARIEALPLARVLPCNVVHPPRDQKATPASAGWTSTTTSTTSARSSHSRSRGLCSNRHVPLQLARALRRSDQRQAESSRGHSRSYGWVTPARADSTSGLPGLVGRDPGAPESLPLARALWYSAEGEKGPWGSLPRTRALPSAWYFWRSFPARVWTGVGMMPHHGSSPCEVGRAGRGSYRGHDWWLWLLSVRTGVGHRRWQGQGCGSC